MSRRRLVSSTLGLILCLTIGAPAAFASVAAPSGQGQIVTAAPKHYKNCTALNKVYPHGVGRTGARDRVSGKSKPVKNFKVSTATYNANKGSDRDKDGIACEKR